MGDFLMRRRKLVAVTLVVVWLTSAVLAVFYLGGGSYETSWGERISRGEDYLYIEGETLTQEDLEYIAGLRRLRGLHLSNCNVGECRLPEIEFASRELWSFDLSGTTGLWDLSFLSRTPAESIDLSNCPHVEDLTWINKEVLAELTIDGTEVSDLSPIIGSKITRISFANTDVSDISSLASLGDELWEVNGSDTLVTSIDALANNHNLYRLHFDGCAIDKVTVPFASERLSELSLARTGVTDVSGFSGCKSLQLLDLGGNESLDDVAWLDPECYKSLITLDLGQTSLNAEDVSWVASCTGLESLTLDGIELGNLDLCRRIRHLESLSAIDCGLTDVSALANCTELENLLLGYNQLQSIDGLPTPDSEWADMVLDLSHNQLTSVRNMPKGDYRFIMLHGNDPDLGRTIPSGVNPYMVAIDWFSGVEDSTLKSMGRLSTIYMLGYPNAESDEQGSSWWWWRVELVDEEELLTLLEEEDLTYTLYGSDVSGYVDIARKKRGSEG